MGKTINIQDISDSKIQVLLDEKLKLLVSLTSPIQASQIYDSLDYTPGDTYKVIIQKNGHMPEDAVDLFGKFYNDLTAGINSENASINSDISS